MVKDNYRIISQAVVLPFCVNSFLSETNGNVSIYVYDASGSPIGVQYQLGTPFDQLISEGIIKIFGD